MNSGEQMNLKELIQETASGIRNMEGTSETYILKDEEWMPAGTAVCDWTAMALAFAGEEEAYDAYLERLEAYVSEQFADVSEPNGSYATDYHRTALTVLALGGDPTSFGGVDLIADGTYNYDGDLGTQGNNGYIYALMTLDAKDYEVPEDAVYTREAILQSVLDGQSEEGGFAMVGNSGSDVDFTAMALQALAPYQEQPEVADAIEEALDWLSNQMSQYGTFVNGDGEESCESSAQVLMALGALGIDPETDERFTDGDVSLLAGLEQFRLEDGTYMHKLEDGETNLMASEQALLALEAIERVDSGEAGIWDMTAYVAPESAASTGVGMYVGIGAAVVVVLAAAMLVIKKKKSAGKE